MVGDLVFAGFVLFGLVFGARRGIYKELIAFAALIVAVAAARTFRDFVGGLLGGAGLEAQLAQLVAAAGIFIVVAFLLNVLGRLLLRKLRDPDAENRIGGAAQKVAAGAAGKKTVGPITFITNPLASAHKGIVYWTDKLGGAALGVVKGAVAAYCVFGIVSYADMAADGHWSFTQSIHESKSAEAFTNTIAPLLRQVTEYRLLENVSRLDAVAHDPQTKPNTIERISSDDGWAPLKAVPTVQRVLSDADVRRLWDAKDSQGRRDVASLIRLPAVRALIADPEFRRAFADIDVDAIVRRGLGATTGNGDGTKK